MAELLRCQTGSGRLVVTDEGVYLARPSLGMSGTQTASVQRTGIAGADMKLFAPRVFGMGGAISFTLRLQDGSRIAITAVPWREAKLLQAYLGIPDM